MTLTEYFQSIQNAEAFSEIRASGADFRDPTALEGYIVTPEIQRSI